MYAFVAIAVAGESTSEPSSFGPSCSPYFTTILSFPLGIKYPVPLGVTIQVSVSDESSLQHHLSHHCTVYIQIAHIRADFLEKISCRDTVVSI